MQTSESIGKGDSMQATNTNRKSKTQQQRTTGAAAGPPTQTNNKKKRFFALSPFALSPFGGFRVTPGAPVAAPNAS